MMAPRTGGQYRTRAAAAFAMVMAMGALAGCSSDTGPGGEGPPPSSSTTQSSAPPSPRCDIAAPLPTLPTWAAHGGSWGTFVHADAARPQGIRGSGTLDPGLSLLINHSGPVTSTLNLDVDLLLASGEHPEGAGVAFHWSGDSYNLVRYSPSEGGWHVFTVLGDNRTKIEATTRPGAPDGPGFCRWVALRVEVEGAEVHVHQDGAAVLTVTLPAEAVRQGQAGLFLRGESIALFSGYRQE